MPVPKAQEELYGRLVGHFINKFKMNPEEAKAHADKIISDHPDLRATTKKKSKTRSR